MSAELLIVLGLVFVLLLLVGVLICLLMAIMNQEVFNTVNTTVRNLIIYTTHQLRHDETNPLNIVFPNLSRTFYLAPILSFISCVVFLLALRSGVTWDGLYYLYLSGCTFLISLLIVFANLRGWYTERLLKWVANGVYGFSVILLAGSMYFSEQYGQYLRSIGVYTNQPVYAAIQMPFSIVIAGLLLFGIIHYLSTDDSDTYNLRRTIADTY